MSRQNPILIGSTFPLSLVRRHVQIVPRSTEELLTAMFERQWVSFWGHDNTVELASAIVCADLRPLTSRPAVVLNADNLPTLDGQTFTECWVLSPDYTAGFRPALGVEVTPGQIVGWQVLQILWHMEEPQ